jgi:hypothetical protein
VKDRELWRERNEKELDKEREVIKRKRDRGMKKTEREEWERQR